MSPHALPGPASANFRVACIPESVLLQARLRDALGAPGRVVSFPDTAAALPAILRGEIRCTVIAVEPQSFVRAVETIRVLRHATPSHAVVAWVEMKAFSARQLLDIAQAGVAELVLRDVDDLRHVLARILSSATLRTHVVQIDQRLSSTIPVPVRALFRFALEQAHQNVDIVQVAAAFGITRQTLRNRLVQHGLPLPRTFVTWCRLLVAASMLDESGHTLDSVGWQLDYSSGQHLGVVLRRYVGSGIAELRDAGVFASVESAFLSTLRAARKPRPRTTRLDDMLRAFPDSLVRDIPELPETSPPG